MKKLKVNATKSYDIIVGDNVSLEIGSLIKERLPKINKIMIVTETNVFPLYSNKVADILRKCGYDVYLHVFKAGEESKTLSTVINVINDLALSHFTRTDAILALGGGVTGDLAGFAASIYLRGITVIQMPTTLLSAVDSSVGGKTGVDLPVGKNLVGAFWQPSLVVCDTSVIEKLPKEIFSQGMAEVIKYGILVDKDFFNRIKEKTISLEEIIYKCVKIKAEIVETDEFDNGKRQLLNLGHTFGHAIEYLSAFSLSHGQAIAIGIIKASEFSNKIGYGNVDVDLIKETLRLFDLPITSNYSNEEIFEALLNDKKIRGKEISLILPKEIGNTQIYKIDTEKFKELFS